MRDAIARMAFAEHQGLVLSTSASADSSEILIFNSCATVICAERESDQMGSGTRSPQRL
jgi:hypothetical protein